jgi:hypothetical protein
MSTTQTKRTKNPEVAASVSQQATLTREKSLSVIWYANKESLYAAHPDPKFILAKDVNDTGAKSFAVLPQASQFREYISTLPTPNLNEVIPETRGTPVYVYMDLDKELGPHDDHTIDYTDLLSRFECIFTEFMQAVYNTSIHLQRGVNYQAGYTPISPTKPKLSMHIKVNIVCRNVEILKSLITNLDRYMSSNLYVTPEDRARFYYYKLKSKQQKYTPLIDQAVYTNFRGYRTLYSSKLNKSNALIPLPGFSTDPLDHLVVCYPDIPQSTIPADIQNIHANVLADYTTSKATSLSPTLVNLPEDYQSETSAVTAEIPHTLISQLEDTILTSPDIRRTFGDITFKYSQFRNPTVYTYNIDKSCQHLCPYANRTHKHNRSFFEYHYKYNTLRYKCYNEECVAVQKRQALVFKISSTHDALKRFNDLNPRPTLHCKEKIIQWDESYDHPSMFEYPLKQLALVRANMGTGKTHSLIYNFITQHCLHPDTKCLFITYQILLSKKYHHSLQHFGFMNYHGTQGPLLDNKLIVCLDSLHRVHTQNFDFIFIDEVLSVLLHFNSNLMKQVSTVSSLFELLLLQARHVYLLDAAVDNSMVYNFASYLSEKKNVAPYYIRNVHVKPSNRRCTLYVNRLREGGYPKALKYTAFERVASLLAENKKVVVSSSTKTFTKELMQFLSTRPEAEGKNVIVYNSDSDKTVLHEHASDLDAAWCQYDVVIYSPTIGAGLSFDARHFDNLVGYMDNSFKAPTVDLILQQLFRVRALTSGEMDLYIEDSLVLSPFNYPTSEEHIEDWLDNNMRIMHAYFPPESLNYEAPMVIDNSGIRYDKTRLSFYILKGIAANKNKSLLNYSKTIANTLQTDYNIPCKVVNFKTTDDVLVRALALFQEIRKTLKQKATIPFTESLLIDYEIYIDLQFKEQLTDTERLQKWIYDMAELWGVPLRRVDEPFFNEWIGQVHDYEKTLKKFYRAQRLQDALTKTMEENQQAMYHRLEALVKNPAIRDANLELYRTSLKKHFEQLIETQFLLQEVFGGETLSSLKTEPLVIKKGREIKAKFAGYVSRFTQERFEHLRQLFGLDVRNYESLAKLKNEGKNQHSYIGSLLREGLGASYKRSKRAKNKESFCEEWSINTTHTHNMVGKYSPKALNFGNERECMLIDADEDDYES